MERPESLPLVNRDGSSHENSLEDKSRKSVPSIVTNEQMKTTPRYRWRANVREVTWCLLMHIFLIVVHGVLLLVAMKQWEHGVIVSLGDAAARLQTGLTIGASAFGALYTSLLLMYTQRLSLRRDLLRPQTLTSLHDRTATWLGLGAALNVVRKQMSVYDSTTITALYLFCVFGLHNTIPALFNVISMESPVREDSSIVGMTFNNSEVSPLTYQLLPAISAFSIDTSGLNGSMIYDIFRKQPPVENGTVATICATKFTTPCELMSDVNLSSLNNASGPIASFADGWSVQLPLDQVGDPLLRIVPTSSTNDKNSPPAVPYVTLLAMWNVTDVNSGTANNTLHVHNYDLSFLKCDLTWEVHSATINSSNALVNVSNTNGTCDRRLVPGSVGFTGYDSVSYNWTAVWTQAISWWAISDPGGRLGVNNSIDEITLGIPEEYLMNILGWDVFWNQNTLTQRLKDTPPTIEAISNGLANLTAAVFWAAAMSDFQSVRLIHSERYIIHGHLNVSETPVVVGLILSVVMTALVALLFRGRESTMKGVQNAGVLELAWLFARSSSGYTSLVEVEVPTEQALRKAGKGIEWKGSLENREMSTW